MTKHERDPRQIMTEWLSTPEIGGFLGLTGDAIVRKVHRGIYRTAKKVPGRGGGVWAIHIYDENLPPEIAQLYEQQIRGLQPQCFLSIREMQIIKTFLQSTTVLLRQVLQHLSAVLKEMQRPE